MDQQLFSTKTAVSALFCRAEVCIEERRGSIDIVYLVNLFKSWDNLIQFKIEVYLNSCGVD